MRSKSARWKRFLNSSIGISSTFFWTNFRHLEWVQGETMALRQTFEMSIKGPRVHHGNFASFDQTFGSCIDYISAMTWR